MVRLLLMILLLKLVGGLMEFHMTKNPLQTTVKNGKLLKRILNTIIAKQYGGNRRINSRKPGKTEDVFKILRSKRPKGLQAKVALRSVVAEADDNNEQEHIIETELTESLNNQESLYMKKPFVEHKGQNDFLVMDINDDSFVTVIPNAIYYNIEKKCTNWLDDCSLQGIRARLLHKVNSPYK